MHCPLCDYDLTGLPAEHTCPECGFKCDPHATAVKLAARKRHYTGLLMAGGYGLFFMYFAFRLRGPDDDIVVVIALLFVLVAALRLAKTAGHPSRIVLSRAGIQVEHPELGVGTIRWTDVVEARYSWITGAFQIIGSSEKPLLRCRYDRLGSPRIARRCAAEINRLLSVYAPASAARDRQHGHGAEPHDPLTPAG